MLPKNLTVNQENIVGLLLKAPETDTIKLLKIAKKLKLDTGYTGHNYAEIRMQGSDLRNLKKSADVLALRKREQMYVIKTTARMYYIEATSKYPFSDSKNIKYKTSNLETTAISSN
jgi:hypothetical protein